MPADALTFDEAAPPPTESSFEDAAPPAELSFEEAAPETKLPAGWKPRLSAEQMLIDPVTHMKRESGMEAGTGLVTALGDAAKRIIPELPQRLMAAPGQIAALGGKGVLALANLPTIVARAYAEAKGHYADMPVNLEESPRPQLPRTEPGEVPLGDKKLQAVAGVGNVLSSIYQELLPVYAPPEVGLTLPILGGRNLVAKIGAVVFGADLLSKLPQEIQDAYHVVKDPDAPLQQKIEAVGKPGVSAGFAALLLHSGLRGGEGIPSSKMFEKPAELARGEGGLRPDIIPFGRFQLPAEARPLPAAMLGAPTMAMQPPAPTGAPAPANATAMEEVQRGAPAASTAELSPEATRQPITGTGGELLPPRLTVGPLQRAALIAAIENRKILPRAAAEVVKGVREDAIAQRQVEEGVSAERPRDDARGASQGTIVSGGVQPAAQVEAPDATEGQARVLVKPAAPEVFKLGNPASIKNQWGHPLGTIYHGTPEDYAAWQGLMAKRNDLIAAGKLEEALALPGVEPLKNKYGGSPPAPPKEAIAPTPKPAAPTAPAEKPGTWRPGAADLTKGGRVHGKPESHTNVLAALLDTKTKEVHLVGAYETGDGAVRLVDPDKVAKRRKNPHSALASIQQRYTILGSILRDEPTNRFHTKFANEAEFNQRVRDPAIAAAPKVADLPEMGWTEEGGEKTREPIVTSDIPLERGEMLDHMRQYKTYEEAVQGLASSEEGSRLEQILFNEMDALKAKGVPDPINQALKNFYAESQTAPAGQPGVTQGPNRTSTEVRRAQPPQGQGPISVGPGAASPGDVPLTSQLTQLSRLLRSQSISPREPLGDRISRAVDVAGRWSRGKDRVTTALAKMTAAKDALADAYLRLPKWTDFTTAIGRWTGADQKTSMEVRQFQKAIRAAVPNRIRQEAITNWIQADGDDALLVQRAAASKPNVRPGYEAALTLNDAERTLARNIQSYLESRLDEGIKQGILKQGVENYVNQVWKRPTTETQRLWADLFGTGALNPHFKFARKRIFDSYFEGEQAGFTPKDKSIGYLLSVYDMGFNRALSARALIKELHEGKAADGMPITMLSGKTQPIIAPAGDVAAYLVKPNKVPEDAVTKDGRPYRAIDHWALRDWKWATKGPEGQNVFVQGDMLVHPDHWQHLNNVLKTSRLQANPVTRTLLQGQSLLKQTKLSLSGFHLEQEALHALAHRVNPLTVKAIDLDQPLQKALVDHGLMVSDPRGYALFSEGSSGGGLVGKIPGLGHLQIMFNDMLFKDAIPRIKMQMALDALERNRKAYAGDVAKGKITDDQLLALTARESNTAFGEQDYRMLGRSPTVQDFLRLSILAPDFLEARARFVAQALKPYGREQRIALALMAGTVYTAARVLNKALDDDYHLDKPFSVVYKGREYTLRTVVGDLAHLWNDPGGFWRARTSPIGKAVAEFRNGRDDRGIKRNAMEQFVDFLQWFKPIPLQQQPGETGVQTGLSSVGVTSKADSRVNELYKILDDWRSKQTDPKVKEIYDRNREETHADSPYATMRFALQRNDLVAARKEFVRLQQAHTVHRIFLAMEPSKPFTGSYISESTFTQSLTPSQKPIYDTAKAERLATYQKFLRVAQAQ